ncbi:MAG: peptide chain release factor N(5)-glutamine methyltransferase [Ignavibacteriaceae bacterium]
MLTILDSINLSTEYLKNKGIDSPRINAELLLAHILKCKRLELYLSYDRPLKEDEVVLYRELLKRRSKFEPLQYITGLVEFYGLEFKVGPAVLIPRPETELLVEEILKTYPGNNNLKILDIGTGSGNIAVSLAKHLQNSSIIAIDISDEALKVARENAELNNISGKIQFVKHDILSGVKILENDFDAVVSNPPYVTQKDFGNLDHELKDFEPAVALTDQADGLSFYKAISSYANLLLKKGGKIFFEIGHCHSEQVNELLLQNNFSNILVRKDYQNIDRVILGELL